MGIYEQTPPGFPAPPPFSTRSPQQRLELNQAEVGTLHSFS